MPFIFYLLFLQPYGHKLNILYILWNDSLISKWGHGWWSGYLTQHWVRCTYCVLKVSDINTLLVLFKRWNNFQSLMSFTYNHASCMVNKSIIQKKINGAWNLTQALFIALCSRIHIEEVPYFNIPSNLLLTCLKLWKSKNSSEREE